MESILKTDHSLLYRLDTGEYLLFVFNGYDDTDTRVYKFGVEGLSDLRKELSYFGLPITEVDMIISKVQELNSEVVMS